MKGNPVGTVSSAEKYTGTYILGGDSSGAVSSIVKFTFRFETAANLSSSLPRVVYAHDQSGFSNNGVAGYGAQGIQAGVLRKEVYKLAYSGETTSTLSDLLSEGYYYSQAFTYGSTAGYVAGGFYTSGRSRNLDKITYSNDSKSQVSLTFFPDVRSEGAGGYSSTNGYVIGGELSNSTNVDKVVFSNETTSRLSGVLSSGYVYGSAITRLDTCVYVYAKYYQISNNTSVDKFNVSNDTSAALSATISGDRISCASGWSRSAGYMLGGYKYTGGSGNIDLIQKLTFSNDTISTLSATLPAARSSGPGVSNY